MLDMKHPNIIRVHGVCIGKDPLMIIMELASGGSLLSHLRKRKNEIKPLLTPMDESEDYVYEICSGMAYLEEKPASFCLY